MNRTIKELTKAVTPPILMDAQRRIRGRQPLRFFWRGIYKNFAEVPAKGQGFRNPVWLNSTRAAAEQWMDSWDRTGMISGAIPLAHSLLPLLAALDRQEEKPFKVLDFGGGMGVGYIAALECMPANNPIDYHIVDNVETCKIGEELFGSHTNLHFHRVVPRDIDDLDVVYLSTSLQYVEDYSALLRQLAGLGAKFFLFVSLQAADNPTFVSAQINFEDQSVVPCWFFNLEEILGLMTSLHYRLVYQSTTDRTYDMANFAQPYRVSRYCNLLFQLQV